MQSSPLIVVFVMNSWLIHQCKKLFYSLLCAETSTNELPDEINYIADHFQVFFPEISSLSGLWYNIRLLDGDGSENCLGSVLMEDLVDFQCSSPQPSKFESILMFIILNLNELESVRRDSALQ